MTFLSSAKQNMSWPLPSESLSTGRLFSLLSSLVQAETLLTSIQKEPAFDPDRAPTIQAVAVAVFFTFLYSSAWIVFYLRDDRPFHMLCQS